MAHRDDTDCEAGGCHDEKLQHLGEDHAEHATLDHIEGRNGRNNQAIQVDINGRIGGELEGQKGGRKLAYADKPVGEESNDIEQGEDHNYDVGQMRPFRGTESKRDPLCAGHHATTAQPDRQVDHQEDLIEHGPEPRYPDALHPIDEE